MWTAWWEWFQGDAADAKAARHLASRLMRWVLLTIALLGILTGLRYVLAPTTLVAAPVNDDAQRCEQQLRSMHKTGVLECGTCLHDSNHCCLYDYDQSVVQLPAFSIVQESGSQQSIRATTWACSRRSAKTLEFVRSNRVRIQLDGSPKTNFWLDAEQAFCARLLWDMLRDALPC